MCVLALLASGAMTLALFRFWETLGAMGAWGYAGVFVAELANSASILIPLPAHNYALALSLSLNPLILGVAGASGQDSERLQAISSVGTGARRSAKTD